MSAYKLSLILFFIISIASISCSSVSEKTGDNYEVVELPDGSAVFLNHNSSVEYSESFNPRNIELRGEAFFVVNPGETPFIVSTSSGEIQVLGTEFNVKADLKDIELEVEEGIVTLKTELHSEKLKRGERAVYNNGKDIIQKGKAEFKHKVWTNELKAEFRKMGREIKQEGKEAGKEFKKVGKEIKKEFK